MRSLRNGALIVALLLALMVPPHASALGPVEDLDPTILATGVLSGGPGIVYAVGWPKQETMQAMARPGEDLALPIMAVTTAGSDGSFMLRVDANTLVSYFADPHGNEIAINMTIIGEPAGGGVAQFPTHRTYRAEVAPANAITFSSLVALSPPSHIALSPGVGASYDLAPEAEEGDGDVGVVDEVTAPAEAADDALVAAESAVPRIALFGTANRRFAGALAYCWAELESNFDPSWVAVGELFNSRSSTSQYTYLSGSSSSVGVGVSASGAKGSWSRQGTETAKSTTKIDYAPAGNSTWRFYDTQFRKGKYSIWCPNSWGGYSFYNYEARTNKFVGGSRRRTPAAAPASNYCAFYRGGDKFTRASNHAVRYSTGFKIEAAIGINLSSKTGYNSQSSIRYSFSANNRMCGNTDYPSHSTRVRALSEAGGGCLVEAFCSEPELPPPPG